MLYTKTNSQTYIATFTRKFTNFIVKAPFLMSLSTSPTKVEITNEDTEQIYPFEWDFTIPVKTFIYGIKQILIRNHCYPVITTVDYEEEAIPIDEQVDMAMSTPIDSIPVKRVKEIHTRYMIDKVLSSKDQFIIENLDTGKKYRYKMDKGCTFFLHDMKSGKLNEFIGAKYFFKHCTLMNEIVLKEEND